MMAARRDVKAERSVSSCLPYAQQIDQHAVITHEDGRHVLRDMGTDNGTYLVGRDGDAFSAERLTAPHVLRDGDELMMGNQSVVFALTDPG